MNMICCKELQELVKNAGKRGFGVVVEFYDNKYVFWLQSRGCDEDDIQELRETKGEGGVVNLLNPSPFQYCPFCGTDVQQRVKQNPEMIKEFVESTKRFISFKR